MQYVHPDEMTREEREQRVRDVALGVARSRLAYYEENPKVKRGAAYEDAKRVIGRLS